MRLESPLRHSIIKSLYNTIFKPKGSWSPLPSLPAPISLHKFRDLAFNPELPHYLPQSFSSLTAISKWFKRSLKSNCISLNHSIFSPYAETLHLPTEISTPTSFHRIERLPLSYFLSSLSKSPTSTTSSDFFSSSSNQFEHDDSQPESEDGDEAKLYISQCPLTLLPSQLLSDIPTPELVKEAGKGDIYTSSLWLGMAPTSTPLHKDPNPNLLIQLAGRKRIRILPPALGADLMLQIKRGGDGGAGAGGIGAMALTESDMIGPTRQRLEILVWGDDTINTDNSSSTTDENNSITNKLGELGGQEITLKEGDGIFIPKGWYHAVRGIGVGVNCSVNWWFR